MFANLTDRLRQVVDHVRGRGRLTDENIQEAVREVRRALIEADVALPVIRDLIARVQERAVGTEINRSLTPGQAFIAILQQEITAQLGTEPAALDLRHRPPVPILLVGLQGGGKTTSAGKLAVYLKERLGRRPMLVSLDTRRPAAMLQLERLAAQAGVSCAPASPSEQPADIARRAMDVARREQADVLILDTAGRTRLDDELLAELRELHALTGPAETLFVLDSMAGQDAVNAARAFAATLPVTGIILTKADGDARGGAALSARAITGQPIKFVGTGEKLPALEAFVPERMATRILGMGDVLGLVEDIGQKVDKAQAERLARKVGKGQGFDLADLREQLQQMMGMGGLESLLAKLPLPGGMSADKLAGQMDPAALRRQIAIINSMTPSERRFPKSINGSRRQRIARGAGVGVPDVNRLLKQHEQMQKVMKRFSKGGLQKAMRNMPGGAGRFTGH
ncbi:MAG: signal recognition particle protein [Gammaproteobacteria bacterium]|nr:MAG: signal recognition particle protein [Pseudomonadota bacterium]MBC6945250.1 signal recognition particle protein [Gammaproteobacteria bacterium]MCE7901105.1 signal recognition particle protein [Gammaproteobacteria bacterium PRO9]MDL1880109.1 signal recognition particle protein [Gammaproteobacteria bacterium PRO2]MCL4776270.1 signal recognition particle protein [Gammaproteobacteria bacterium]